MRIETAPLKALDEGQRFVLPGTGTRGTLLHKGIGSAAVKLERRKETSFKTNDGKKVRFSTATKTTWSLETEVVPI